MMNRLKNITCISTCLPLGIVRLDGLRENTDLVPNKVGRYYDRAEQIAFDEASLRVGAHTIRALATFFRRFKTQRETSGYVGNIKSEGQAAVEFIVIVVVLLFFLLFFMSLSFLFVVSTYLDYATFMAARTLKTAKVDRDDQENTASRVFLEYAQRVNGIARNFRVQFAKTDPLDEQTSGIITSYDIDLFYLPPIFVSDKFPSRIRLESEAHLGRDPPREECLDFFRKFTGTFNLNLEGTGFLAMMEDNGC